MAGAENDPESLKSYILLAFIVVNLIAVGLLVVLYKKKTAGTDKDRKRLFNALGAYDIGPRLLGFQRGRLKVDNKEFEFRVGAAGRTGPYFKLSMTHRYGKGFKISGDPRAGSMAKGSESAHPELEMSFSRSTHAARSLEDVLTDDETAQSISQMFNDGVDTINHAGERLEARISPFSLAAKSEVGRVQRVAILLDRLCHAIPQMDGAKVQGRLYSADTILKWLFMAIPLILLFIGMLVGFGGWVSYRPLEWKPVLLSSLIVTSPFVFIYIYLATRKFFGRGGLGNELIFAIVFSVIGLPSFVFGTQIYINGSLDNSTPQSHFLKVERKDIEKSEKGAIYLIHVKSWRKGRDLESIRTWKEPYSKIREGVTEIEIATKEGALGYEWVYFARAPIPNKKAEPIWLYKSRAMGLEVVE